MQINLCRGEVEKKISGNFTYATPIDFDESFSLPSSMKARVGYHKAFSDNILGVLALEYEKQFFVNVAKTGSPYRLGAILLFGTTWG